MDSEYLSRSSAIAARMVGDEMIIMSVADSMLFCLNEVAAVIWRAADGKTPLSKLVVQTVCQQFEVNPEVAVRDAREFAATLSRHAILVFSDQPIPHASSRMAVADLRTESSGHKSYSKPGFRYECIVASMALSCGRLI